MKTTLFVLLFGASILRAESADFARSGKFESVDAFVAAATAFQPATHKSDLTALFTVKEPGQTDDPKAGSPVVAKTIETASMLWSDESHALIFVRAAPPTEATPSAVGVLFLLEHEKDAWRIADSLRFSALGKWARVVAEITANPGSGTELKDPVVTVQETQGGRGYNYGISASYAFEGSKLKRMELE